MNGLMTRFDRWFLTKDFDTLMSPEFIQLRDKKHTQAQVEFKSMHVN